MDFESAAVLPVTVIATDSNTAAPMSSSVSVCPESSTAHSMHLEAQKPDYRLLSLSSLEQYDDYVCTCCVGCADCASE